MVHHHLIGQVGPELSLVDFLVEQRLNKQTTNQQFLLIIIPFSIFSLCSSCPLPPSLLLLHYLSPATVLTSE